jgi:hypothetical protein
MVTIYLENNELDINEGFSQQITYAVDDLQNLDSKSTAFSKTIVIPGTAKNNKLFGNIFEFTNSNFTIDGANVGYNFNASKAAKVRLEINGLTAIKGVLRLLTIIHDGENIEYEVAIFGELGGFVNALGNKKLEDLDFSAYNHDYTIANIENSWDGDLQLVTSGNFYNGDRVLIDVTEYQQFYIGDIITISGTASNDGNYTIKNVINDVYTIIIGTPITFKTQLLVFNESVQNGSDGSFTITYPKKGRSYFYPLIDYGLVSTNKKDYQYTAFRPALYVREYLDKIIRGAGYTYESNFLDSDFFTRLIIPHNKQRLEATKLEALTATLDNTYNQNGFSSVIFSPTYLGLFTTPNNIRFDYIGATTLTFDFNFSFNLYIQGDNDFFGSYQIGLSLISSDYPNGSFPIYEERIPWGSGSVTKIINATLSDFTIRPNAQISFRLWLFNVASAEISSSSLNVLANELVSLPVILGDEIKLNETIPVNVYQKDFFTSIIKMFYLMVTEDKEIDRHLIIEPWVEFYDLSRTSYLDWSDKIDRSQPIKIVPMSEINSRYYNINYKPDSDYFNEDYKKKFNEGYGNVVFDNQLDFAKDSSTTEVIFSATPLVGYEDEDKVVSTIFKWDGTTTDKEEKVASNIRILQSKLIESVTSWTIKNGATTLATNTNYPYAGHLDDPDVPGSDLSFGIPKQLYFTLAAGALGNNLFNTYYSSYLSEITDKDSRLVIAKIKLNEQDIFNLDFGRFIWIDGVLYRLSRIIDYSAGEICTIELLRVIYTTYATGSPAQTECILTEDSICLQTEGKRDNITIEN